MKFNSIVSFFALAVLLCACNASKNKAANSTTSETDAIVGNDQDEHGCRASAGYTWSALQGKCIRLFESGIRLDPQAPNLDKTLSAFIVFKNAGDNAKAEVFLSSDSKPQLFEKQTGSKDSDTVIWKGGKMTIKYSKGVYMLEDANKKVLYQGL